MSVFFSVVRQRGTGQFRCRAETVAAGALSELFAGWRQLPVRQCSVLTLGVLLRTWMSRAVNADLQSPQHPRRLRQPLHSLRFARGSAEAKLHIGHGGLCVCVSVPRRIPTLLHGPGCNLGEW